MREVFIVTSSAYFVWRMICREEWPDVRWISVSEMVDAMNFKFGCGTFIFPGSSIGRAHRC